MPIYKDVSLDDDSISIRDLGGRIDELDSEHEAYKEAVTEAQEAFDNAPEDISGDALEALRDALTEAEKELSDWVDEFESDLTNMRELYDACSLDDHVRAVDSIDAADYARESADSMGVFSRGTDENSWPFTHIDWEAAGQEILNDLTQVDAGGKSFYVM